MGKWRYVVAAVAIAGAGTTATAARVAAPAALASAARAAAPAVISSGTFRSVVYLRNVISPAIAMPTAVAIGRITGSSRSNLVVTTVDRNSNGGGTTVAVYPQLATGKLGTPLTVRTPDQNDVTTKIAIADLYGDGHLEILLPEVHHVDVFGYSGGHLTSARIPVPANALAVGNFNGDRYPDLVITTTQADTTQVWTGSASRAFRLWRTVLFPQAGSNGTNVFAADLDHNGLADIAVPTGTGFAVRLQARPGTFGTERLYTIGPVNGQLFPPSSIAIGDVTSDGYPDVVTGDLANRPWSAVEVFANERNGTFRVPVVYRTLDIPAVMTIADLTGNGRGDLVVEHACWANIGVLLQQANRTLGPESLYPAQVCDYGPEQPAVGDLNGDGKPDIAAPAGDKGIAILYGK